MGKEEEKRILSVEDILHLQSDQHEKKAEVMPDVDTSRYVLKQRPKTESVRSFVTTANITEEQRKQFNQGSNERSSNAILAERAKIAINVAKSHAEEEAVEHDKNIAEKKTQTDENAKKLAQDIRTGNFDFGFGALIEGSENLKDTI